MKKNDVRIGQPYMANEIVGFLAAELADYAYGN